MKVLYFILSIFSSYQLLAGESIAELIYSKGEVSLTRANKKVKVQNKIFLYEGDLLKTSSESFAILRYDHSSTLKIDGNTSLKLTELDQKLSQDNNTLSLKLMLLKGSLMMKLYNPEKNKEVRIDTRTVSIGVRGTELLFADEENKDIHIAVNEGEVDVLSYDNDDYEPVKSGQSMIVEDGKNLTTPMNSSWQKKLNWNFKNRAVSGFSKKELRKKRRQEIKKNIKGLRKRLRKRFKHLRKYKKRKSNKRRKKITSKATKQKLKKRLKRFRKRRRHRKGR